MKSIYWAQAILFALILTSFLNCQRHSPKHQPVLDDELVLLYTTSLQAELEPCGCITDQLGGLARRGELMAQVRRQYPHVVSVDSGDILFNHYQLPAYMKSQLRLKAETIGQIYKRIGYDAVIFGEADFALGVEFALNMRSLPFAHINLRESATNAMVGRPRLIERGGCKVAIAGVVSEAYFRQLRPAAAKRLRVESEVRAAQTFVNTYRKKADYLILLSHRGLAADKQLAARVRGIDVIVGGHNGSHLEVPVRVGQTLILQANRRGRYVGMLKIPLKRKQGKWINISGRDNLVEEIQFLANDVMSLKNRLRQKGLGKKQEHELTIEIERSETRLSRLEARLRQLPNKSGKYFSNHLEALDRSVRKRSDLDSMIVHYHQQVRTMHSFKRQDAAVVQTLGFASDQACRTCHASIYSFWQRTAHADAYETLVDAKQETNLECIGCHVTGFGHKQGWNQLTYVSSFKDVQCEACHGPHAAHAKSGNPKLANKVVSEKQCLTCHTPEFSPGFVWSTANPHVNCALGVSNRHGIH